MVPELKLSSCAGSFMALLCGFCPRRLVTTQTTEGLGFLGRQEVLGTSIGVPGTRPAAYSCAGQGMSWVASESRRQGSPAWLAVLPAAVLPPCSAVAQYAHLPPPCFSADHSRAGSFRHLGWEHWRYLTFQLLAILPSHFSLTSWTLLLTGAP